MVGVFIAVAAAQWLLVMGLFWKYRDLKSDHDVVESRVAALEILLRDDLKTRRKQQGEYS